MSPRNRATRSCRTGADPVHTLSRQIGWLSASGSDYEIAVPLHELTALAQGKGYYEGVDRDTRRARVEQMAEQCDRLYPSLRLFLFDARRVFSSPITVFGPLIGVIYVGNCYLAFRESARVKTLTQHFDWLVREADVDARDAAKHIQSLAERVD